LKNSLSLSKDNIEEIIKTYSDMVYRLAFSKTGNKYDADEVYQEVFLRYVRKNPTFSDEEHRKAWLIRVTLNCSKKLLTSNWNKRTQPLEENIEFNNTEYADLYYELKKLPPKYREVIHLFYYEDMTIETISKVLNRKNSTVRTQLTRARAMLKSFMKEDDYV
jgi:RNA polymerase sigma-70 factor (ECF subfamily)